MKRLLFLSVLTLTASVSSYGAAEHLECSADDTVTAQASALLKVAEKLEAGDCPAPKVSDYKAICADIASRAKAPTAEQEFYEYNYEKQLWNLSCANPTKDSEESAKEKITKMWNKHKKQFKCDAIGFGLQNGNLLKFSLAKNMPDVIETVASIYGLDINFVDPSDGKNILDYVNSEIERLGKQGNSQSAVDVYQKYKLSLIGLGAKPSNP